jgi:hypothetical protein
VRDGEEREANEHTAAGHCGDYQLHAAVVFFDASW